MGLEKTQRLSGAMRMVEDDCMVATNMLEAACLLCGYPKPETQ
jgi:UTP:GlnB (protein PII) uridylyltransferase